MRFSGMTLVTAALCGVVWSGPAASDPGQAISCAAAEKGVDGARSDFAAQTGGTLSLFDKAAVQEELTSTQEAILKRLSATEQQAKSDWQAAIGRYTACASRAGNPACTAEKKGMDDATDRLNAALADRRKIDAELAASREALANLRKQLEEARDKWAAALKALEKARAALAGCRRAQIS
jgi:hypothetical protein